MLDVADGWEIVRTCELFRAVPESVARELLTGRQPIALHKGQILFQRGDRAEAFFVVVAGWIKLSRSDADGAETIVHVARVGETFAEAAMFREGTYPVNAEALTEARVQRIDGRAMRERVSADPSLAFAMLGAMSLRLRGLVDEIERLKGRRALQRVAGFMLELCDHRERGALSVELPFEKTFIAARLGITPESLSRALAKLRAIGVVVAGNFVEIPDRAALAHVAEGGAPKSDCS